MALYKERTFVNDEDSGETVSYTPQIIIEVDLEGENPDLHAVAALREFHSVVKGQLSEGDWRRVARAFSAETAELTQAVANAEVAERAARGMQNASSPGLSGVLGGSFLGSRNRTIKD